MICKINIIDLRIDKVVLVFIRKLEIDWKIFFLGINIVIFFLKVFIIIL